VVRVSFFVWLLHLDPTGMGGPTGSYATAGIALRVSGALKPHHHDKVEIPLVGSVQYIVSSKQKKLLPEDGLARPKHVVTALYDTYILTS
jgi:hypothetical protein